MIPIRWLHAPLSRMLAAVLLLCLGATPTRAVPSPDATDEPTALAVRRLALADGVPPPVQITCPTPTALFVTVTPPVLQIFWEGPTGGPPSAPPSFQYRYLLLGPSSEFPINVALAMPDSLRRYYANHPLGPWAGWDSTGAENPSVVLSGLAPGEEYLFTVIALDTTGGYSPVFNLLTNMLRFRVSFSSDVGPVLTMSGPGFEYRYPHGGYCPCPSAEIPAQMPAQSRATFHWSAEAGFACENPYIHWYRWALDIEDVTDETPRIDEATDLQHWSVRSPDAMSATLGPFAVGEVHRLYVEAQDITGIRSLGIVRLEVVESENRAPQCGAAVAAAPELWPPNHRFEPVHIAGVTDPDGDPVTITVTRVTQDEPVHEAALEAGDFAAVDESLHPNGGVTVPTEMAGIASRPTALDQREPDHRCADAIIDGTGAARVRVERAGHGNGRAYTVWFTASDAQGASCDGSVRVCVPHDRHHSSCVDDGQDYSSLGPCPDVVRGRADRQVLREPALTVKPGPGRLATISYSLPTAGSVVIAVYDIAGRHVATLESATRSAGEHVMTWDTSGLARGMYFCRLRAGAGTVTKGLMLAR